MCRLSSSNRYIPKRFPSCIYIKRTVFVRGVHDFWRIFPCTVDIRKVFLVQCTNRRTQRNDSLQR
jgi:hypothetical protein